LSVLSTWYIKQERLSPKGSLLCFIFYVDIVFKSQYRALHISDLPFLDRFGLHDKNTFGTGSKVILYERKMKQQQEMIPVRGYQSSVNYELVFGLGQTTTLDSLLVIWPDSSVQTLQNVR